MHLPGDRPAWCYTLGSPTHPSQKRARKRHAATRNRRRKMRKVQMENRKRSQQRRWRKWDVSWMKVNRIGWKWKICGNAVSTEAIWWYEQGLKETVTGAAPSKRPSAAQRQLHPRSTSSPLLSQMLTVQVQKQVLKCALLKGCRVTLIAPHLGVLPTERPRTLPLNLPPSHRDLWSVFDDASVGRQT